MEPEIGTTTCFKRSHIQRREHCNSDLSLRWVSLEHAGQFFLLLSVNMCLEWCHQGHTALPHYKGSCVLVLGEGAQPWGRWEGTVWLVVALLLCSCTQRVWAGVAEGWRGPNSGASAPLCLGPNTGNNKICQPFPPHSTILKTKWDHCLD